MLSEKVDIEHSISLHDSMALITRMLSKCMRSIAILSRQETGTAACFSGRKEVAIGNGLFGVDQYHTLIDRRPEFTGLNLSTGGKSFQWQSIRTKLTVKTTTKSHRFSHHIKIDREIQLRSYWKDRRGVENAAYLQRYINFSRIYARFRDLQYLKHTMQEWDVAIARLFDHNRDMQPANELVRKHPYLLNVKILPLQFAKNAVKGKLPLYDWRKVLRDLRILVGEEAESKVEIKPGKRPLQKPEKPFSHARKMGAALQQGAAV